MAWQLTRILYVQCYTEFYREYGNEDQFVFARNTMELPVLDFSDEDACNNSQVLDQLHKAFVNIGFVFITNHGIEKEKVFPRNDQVF